jgi:predicted TIM-barrel fold metal-dependent hydrolase
MHLFPSAAEGGRAVADFPIVEYGERDGVARSARAGTVVDGLAALAEAGAVHGCVLNSFELPGLPHPPDGGWPATPPHAEHAAALRAYNEWVCEAGAAHPELLPFVTVNPAVLGAAEAAEHVAELADESGARGLKLHTIALRADPAEAALAPTFAVCAERGLPVVAHCGPDRHGAGWALPGAFAPVLERQPELPLVLAHLGGAAWRETAAFAAAYPAARFDLSEIVAWTGAPHAPSPAEFVELIRAIGPERVLLGSDFPWYEPADTVAQVIDLPGLGAAEREAILGGNAAVLLGLD